MTVSSLKYPVWTPEQAQEWGAKQPWLVGCNYTPAYAINQLEFWQADTFDPAAIEAELDLAQGIGFERAGRGPARRCRCQPGPASRLRRRPGRRSSIRSV